VKRVAGVGGSPTLRGKRVVLVPVTPEHVAELRRLLATPEVRRRWRAEDASSGWPFDDSSSIRFAIVVDGAVRGMVQYGEEENPDYRHASIDIFIDPAAHGLGWGRDAKATLARHLALRHLAGQPMTRAEALAMRGAGAIHEPPPDTVVLDPA